ncbi:type I DNA topoisomerase [Flexibacter flexilis]|nr:type I DNA topoisomerase [Flexibacter flexilis]
MPKNLVIVESPAKAKTIEGYLGPDFIVKSSFGHVRDLPKGDKAINIAAGFIPTYEISDDKREVVSQLKKAAQEADLVWLASDDDREGEAISWHLKEALKLDESRTRRIVFHEITKNAILKAIQSPRTIDIDLVNAQQARRVLDRLVGFELSPILWKKIKSGLSAGRVQSVAVRLVAEREREVERFNTTSAFKVTATFVVEKGRTFTASLPERFATEAEANAFLEKCKGAIYSVLNLETKPTKKTPAPPFTTSTLQQEASRKLGFSVAQTMTLAQKLYEAGKISYMRTDSVNLSETALEGAKNAIKAAYGDQYVHTRRYKTKSESAQEAHEAIRPTDFTVQKTGGDRSEERLYELIWKRAIASQMADAQLEKTTATIQISTVADKHLVATGEVVKFEGFLAAYIESTDNEDDDENDSKMLPPLHIGQVLTFSQMKATQRFSHAAPRYTEASLVKKLEEMGIGRPSTYAPTISTIIKREYVVKESREGKPRNYQELILQNDNITTKTNTEITGAEKNKLFPTDIGLVVNDFLVQHFPAVVDYSFTANVEKEFDEIAHGKIVWNQMIDRFYKGFHQTVTDTESIDRASAGTSRELGVHPESGKKVIVRLGRFGPMAQIGDTEGEEKPQFASLQKNQRMETITLEDALELFKLPRQVGLFEDKTMTAAVGRFGPYIRHDSKFYSLPKGDDPLSVTEERAIEIIQAKRKADSEKMIKEFPENPDVKVLNGRFGPYIVADGKNVKIPKGTDPASLTLEQCLQLAADTPEKKGRFASKTTAKAADTSEAKTTTKKASSTRKKAASADTGGKKPAAKTKKASSSTASKAVTSKKK